MATPNSARGLVEKVREAICAEWQEAEGSLQSAIVYGRLLEEGVEVPGYQLSAILNSLRVGGLIAAAPCSQREEDIREHGDLLIRDVHSGLCHLS